MLDHGHLRREGDDHDLLRAGHVRPVVHSHAFEVELFGLGAQGRLLGSLLLGDLDLERIILFNEHAAQRAIVSALDVDERVVRVIEAHSKDAKYFVALRANRGAHAQPRRLIDRDVHRERRILFQLLAEVHSDGAAFHGLGTRIDHLIVHLATQHGRVVRRADNALDHALDVLFRGPLIRDRHGVPGARKREDQARFIAGVVIACHR